VEKWINRTEDPMTKERIQALKNISNRRGMFTESTICDCLDECIAEIERLQADVQTYRDSRLAGTIFLADEVKGMK